MCLNGIYGGNGKTTGIIYFLGFVLFLYSNLKYLYLFVKLNFFLKMFQIGKLIFRMHPTTVDRGSLATPLKDSGADISAKWEFVLEGFLLRHCAGSVDRLWFFQSQERWKGDSFFFFH